MSEAASTEESDLPALLDFVCPRCQQETAARFYGPCDDCRGQLREALAGEARDVDVADYEPKMNVTPNAIATKE